MLTLLVADECLIELGKVREDGQTVGHLVLDHVLRVEESRYPKLSFRYLERECVVLVDVPLVQAIKISARRK